MSSHTLLTPQDSPLFGSDLSKRGWWRSASATEYDATADSSPLEQNVGDSTTAPIPREFCVDESVRRLRSNAKKDGAPTHQPMRNKALLAYCPATSKGEISSSTKISTKTGVTPAFVIKFNSAQLPSPSQRPKKLKINSSPDFSGKLDKGSDLSLKASHSLKEVTEAV